MVGVNVTTGVRVGPTGTLTAPASPLFIVGTAQKGPTGRARLVLGMSQFEEIYGEFSSSYSLYDNVRTFFEEGGTRCYVARSMGASASVAEIAVQDSSLGTVFTLKARSAGTWANTSSSPLKYGLSATVTIDGSTATVNIFYKNILVWSGGPFADEILQDGSTKTARQAIVEAINGSTILNELIEAVAGSSTNLPAAGTYDLTGGSESLPNDTQTVDALDLFDYDLGAGAVAAPGSYGSTIWGGLRDHAKANRRIALCGFQVGTTSGAAIAAAQGYWGATTASRTDASYMAFYWPSVKIPDGFGGTKDLAPEAYVAAARSRAHVQSGPWQVGAGDISTAQYVTGLYEAVPRVLGNTLDSNRVNALRIINGVVQVYGARSVSSDEINWRYITYRDSLNYITAQAEIALEPLVFSVIDGRGNLFNRISSILTAIMEPIRVTGGVFEAFNPDTGQQIDRGYSVQVDASNNPVTSLASGVVNAKIGARVSPIADQINVSITKSSLTAPV
jgi:hypothetical protein